MADIDKDISDLVQSSPYDIEKFKNSIIWSDMSNILKDWADGLKTDYDNCNSFEEVRRFQGISEALKYMLNLPDAMMVIATQAIEDKENKNGD